MPFDQPTRNLLAKIVAACRDRLADDVADQLQSRYGLHPDGTALDVARTEDDRRAAEDLRALLAHFETGAAKGDKARRTAAYQRLVREIGFTALNRLAALRLCEERGLLIECVRRGMASDGFQLYDRIAGGALGNRYQTYRAFLESLFDELALDLGVLFDRSTPHSLIFPSEAALTDVLALLNDPELAAHGVNVWQQDETIGWIYQDYNDPAERKAMRKASQAPRNSRELAVRNQFFTPRYVVEFLTDNTLGRLWYEMRQGHTRLVEECGYLVRRPNEVFLKQGEQAPPSQKDTAELSQEELLEQAVYIPHRPLKDPRDLKILDPAAGSGHFLLYAFDLLLVVYEEAWANPTAPPFTETGTRLSDEYADLDTLRRAVPGLILRHNLHGIDIDPRAVQIAALALWLRAQRAYQDLGLDPAERPHITKTNLVTAEPMPGDRELLDEFLRDLRPRVLGDLVRVVFEKMALAGEAGSLLKIEEELAGAITKAHRLWASQPQAEQLALFLQDQPPTAKQPPLFDVSGITDAAFWETAEERVLATLRDYAAQAENGKGTRRRLFAEDAAQGFAFVDLCQQQYTVVLMNPPFGLPTPQVERWMKGAYRNTWQDVYASFYKRALTLVRPLSGFVGAITPKSFYHAKGFRGLRELLRDQPSSLDYTVDIGGGVLDAAVEVCFSVVSSRQSARQLHTTSFLNLVGEPRDQISNLLHRCIGSQNSGLVGNRLVEVNISQSENLPNEMFPYRFPPDLVKLFEKLDPFDPKYGASVVGITTFDNNRFIRTSWEISPLSRKRRDWIPVAMGGGWGAFYSEFSLVVHWHNDAEEMHANEILRYGTTARTEQSKKYWFRPGLTFSKISSLGFSVQPFPEGAVFTSVGFCIFPKRFDDWFWLGYFNSRTICSLVSLYSADRHWHSNNVGSLPTPKTIDKEIASLAHIAYSISVKLGTASETAPEFVCPESRIGREDVATYSSVTQRIDDIVAQSLKLSSESRAFLSENAILHERTFDIDVGQIMLDRLSYAVGSAYGRWDIRIAGDTSLAPKIASPFSPLSACSPGMLVGADGLPAAPNHIVSKAWLRARPDAITLPPEGFFQGPATIPDSEYPIPIAWDGILVDDPGLGEHPELHPDDVVRRVREVLAVLWPENHDAIEAEACEILSVRELRDYFRKPSGFFADHLARYSKSRRKAPIYWPLSTRSGSYTLWLYYHRLDDQILYTTINRYVTPKIAQVEAHIARLEAEMAQAIGRATTALRDQFDETRALLAELREFRAELLRIAALPYKPNLNDGVIINAAPLHKLFGLRRWAQDTEAVWRKLEAGDYDWAHLAYTLWPERVREVCKQDRSIAIAHGLEELCEVEEKVSKRK
jgi:hypothetical protein